MKKTMLTILCILLGALLLASCQSEAIVINTGAGSYEVDDVVTAGSYEGVTASQGNVLLLVSIEAVSADIQDMQSVFFDSVEKGSGVAVYFGDAQTAYPAIAMYYTAHDQSSNPDIRGTIVFEVPSGLQKDSALVMTGEKFEPVSVTVTEVS